VSAVAIQTAFMYSRVSSLGLEILDTYTKLRPDPSGKNILTWNPVVAETMDGFSKLDDKTVSQPPFSAVKNAV